MIEKNYMSRRQFVVGALAAAPAHRLLAQTPSWNSDRQKAIEKLAADEMTKAGIPGLSISIIHGNRMVWSGGLGFADLENNVAAKPETVYRIASISKPITATAAMQLYERGKLDLTAPVQRYVPAFPLKPWPITVRHLLEHTSGIRHYTEEEDTNRRHYQTLTEALEPFKDDALLFEPGTSFRYTSYGFVLLGAAIEGASGLSYTDCVQANILQPCGMNSTRPDDATAIIVNRARGYRRNESGELVNAMWVDQSNKLPAGGWLSTVVDLARFAIGIQEGTLLKPQIRAEMWARVRTPDGREMDYSKGWMTLQQQGSIVAAGHGGNQQGTTAVLNIEPAKKLASVILMNLETYRPIWDFSSRLSQKAAP
jgi:CubicO group peptidase (beta-lactamase class C family)